MGSSFTDSLAGGEFGAAPLAPLGRGESPSPSRFYQCGREKRGRAGSWVSGSAYQEKIERADYGRTGMHGVPLFDAKGLRPLGSGLTKSPLHPGPPIANALDMLMANNT